MDPSGHLATKYSLPSSFKDLYVGILGEHRTKAAAGWAAGSVVFGSIAGVACGVATGGLAGVGCGLVAGGLVGAGGIRTEADYARVEVAIEKAFLAAGDDGTISINVDPMKSTITITGTTKGGRKSTFVLDGVDSFVMDGVLYAGEDLHNAIREIGQG